MEQLGEIPLAVEIVEEDRTISVFFRLLWAQLISLVGQIATVAQIEQLAQTAAIATATAFTVQSAGVYRIVVSLQKTVADGVSSSLTVTVAWISRGVSMTKTFAALTTDTVGANDTSLWQMYVDGNSDIAYQVSYASNTPARMTFNSNVTVERMAA